ncbi:MAG: TIGR02147 family protein [Bacteriovoracaceae bacterium]|jgi:uncharacterized protein (TIGR02147 family)|nr:TIGR02147 family protein [Bacteriovoracaceae bacterium]
MDQAFSIKVFEGESYRDILKKEFQKRVKKNSLYSMRAFSRDLDIPTSRISKIFNSKGGLSIEYARKIGGALGFGEEKLNHFCDLVEVEHGRNFSDRELAKIRLRKYESDDNDIQLEIDKFKILSEWYHFAILELTYLDKFRSDSAWIAKSLKISERQADDAIYRLISNGLMTKDENGKLKATDDSSYVRGGFPSDAIKAFHEQVIEMARTALFEQSVDDRSYSSVIMAMDSRLIGQIKETIHKFNNELYRIIDSSPVKDSVYCLGTQFFNLGETHNEIN